MYMVVNNYTTTHVVAILKHLLITLVTGWLKRDVVMWERSLDSGMHCFNALNGK